MSFSDDELKVIEDKEEEDKITNMNSLVVVKNAKVEETIKQLELILKVRKEQNEIIECAGASCMNCDPDIKALIASIDILKDYKRILAYKELLESEEK